MSIPADSAPTVIPNLNVTTLQLGGVAVTVTAAQINALGLGIYEYKGVYDFAVLGGAVGTIPLTTLNAIPAGAVVMDGILQIVTTFTGTAGGTVAFQAASANDLITAAAYSGFTAGLMDVIPQGLAASALALPSGATPKIVIGTNPLTAGKANLFLRYFL